MTARETARARSLFGSLPEAQDRWMELRRLWIEGNLYRAEEAYGAARVAYGAARKGFADDGRHYYAALVSLDEATLDRHEGDTFDALAMSQEAGLLLVKGAARQEALAALRVLLAALQRSMADRAMVATLARRIASYKPAC